MPRYNDMSKLVFERALELASGDLTKGTRDAFRELLVREQLHNLDKLKQVVEGDSRESQDAD